MNLYNSLTKKIEPFQPKDPSLVRVYTCGPTVYSYPHIGNFRTYIMEDILVRALEYVGYGVKRVMNITDVGHLSDDGDNGEDKMVKGAQRENKTVMEIAAFYTDAFFKDAQKLHIKMPDVVEPATNCIPEYIHLIEVLIQKGFAYKAEGNIYFDTSKLSRYHVFFNFKQEDLSVGVRDGVDADSAKKNPNDFVLWFTKSKFEKQALRWPSPWGEGYPGWHIECSCIAMKHLGEYVDLHAGGIDNAFPHHTNEIAQSEAYLGHTWCSHWLHVAHLLGSDGKKMSKSAGELLTIDQLIEKGFQPEVFRMLNLQSHYRKPLMFSLDTLENTRTAYTKLLSRIQAIGSSGEVDKESFDAYRTRFKDALSDDLNTAMALAVLYDVLKDTTLSGATKIEIIKDFDTFLALDLFKAPTEEKIDLGIDEAELEELISKRAAAKKNRDFATADQIRDSLLARGIRLVDTKDGTKAEKI